MANTNHVMIRAIKHKLTEIQLILKSLLAIRAGHPQIFLTAIWHNLGLGFNSKLVLKCWPLSGYIKIFPWRLYFSCDNKSVLQFYCGAGKMQNFWNLCGQWPMATLNTTGLASRILRLFGLGLTPFQVNLSKIGRLSFSNSIWPCSEALRNLIFKCHGRWVVEWWLLFSKRPH